MTEFRERLLHHFAPIGKLEDNQVAALETHYDSLVAWNARMNLTSTRDMEDMVLRHYCESLFVATQIPSDARSAVDVGSGAGFPGVPIAISCPWCQVTLVESNGRKCVFLRESTRKLTNVEVIDGRAESVTARYDCVFARAVTWKSLLPTLRRLGNRIILLVSGSDSRELMDLLPICWSPPLSIPWGRDRVLLKGDVPRET